MLLQTDAVIGEKSSVTLTNFLDNAWKKKLRVVNWPVGGQFPKFEGCKDTKSMAMSHVRTVLNPRKAELDYAYATQSSDTTETPPTEVAYRVEAWQDRASLMQFYIVCPLTQSLQMKSTMRNRGIYLLLWTSTVMLLLELVMSPPG